jgi:hypothetical protein
MNQQLLNTLLDKTLQYLDQLRETSSHVLSSSLDTLPEEERLIEMEEDPLTPGNLATQSSVATLIESPPPPQDPEQIQPSLPKELITAPIVHATAPIVVTQPLKPHQKDLMQDIKKTLEKVAPTLRLLDHIPQDTEAKKIKNAWKEQANIPDMVILATKSPVLPFLHHVAKAIALHFFSSRVLEVDEFEKQNKWEVFLGTPNLKMIISPDGVLWRCKTLLRYYHEFPNKQERFLGKIPLLLLPDPSLYLKDPALKRSLWNLLCQMIKPLQP